ncbi:ABC transporter ATP-binding protein [Mycetocola saprophilus]|uniref:ABC transporter ATP-binding protein n=1 Tax=Mycetocola saprophilus TaxID=76636 RepID=UPI003BF353E2
MSSPAQSRSPFARRKPQEGPRASFRQLLPFLFEHKRMLWFIILLSVLGALASLAQPLLVSQVIGRVQKNEMLGSLVWALVALVVISALLMGYQHYLLQRTGEGVVLSSRKRLISRMLRLPVSEFDARRTGDLVSRVGSDTTLLRAVLTQGLIEAIGGAVTFVGALIAMLILDPVLLGLTVLVVAVSVLVVVALSARIRQASAAAQARVGDLTSAVERAISSVRTVRAAGATEREIAGVEQHATAAWKMGIRVAKASALVVPVAGIAMQASLLVVLGVGGFRVASGAIEISSLVAFVMFLFMMIMPLGQAFGALTATNQALGALGRIQEIIDLPAEDANDAEIAAALSDPGTVSAEAAAIEFRDVKFGYATAPATSGVAEADEIRTVTTTGERTEVLRGVSFIAERGTRTALVGPSGAGKSTILALIERFYDPQDGAILFGGRDIRALDRGDLRGQIGYVEQDAPVLAGSLRDNLLLGAPDATDADCERVLRDVNLGEVLARNSAGLDAAVGEDGIMLSGGERQRLAIARALLAAHPVLLLDESTSSLDGQNEQLMRVALDAVAKDRTLIIIAHRLSTVVDSDKIVVLEHGTVLGTGTHSELVAEVPLYRDLAKHQFLV